VKAFIEELQYPHWLIVAGAFLLMVGLVGLALRKKNNEGDPTHPA
jgi:LPXTG-motif cell wall-anchored protein